jgi:outer membrane protein
VRVNTIQKMTALFHSIDTEEPAMSNVYANSNAPSRRSRLVVSLALAFGSAFGLTQSVQAQSLFELYEAARGYDAVYLSARSLAESAQYKAAQADALLMPGARLTAGANHNNIDPPLGGNKASYTTSAAFTGSQPLFNRANVATVGQARKALELSRFELETAEQDLIVRVSQAYFDVLGAQDSLATTRTSKLAISEQLASAKRNFEVGTATITDTREAQARFDLASAAEIAADNDLRTKRIALDQLVNKVNVAPKQLRVPVVMPTVPGVGVDEWVARAETQHPAVQRAVLGMDIAKLETDKAKAGHLPTVDAVGSISNSYGRGTAVVGASGSTNSLSLGVQMNLPLFAGYSVQNRVKETLVLEDKARNDLDAARRAVAQGTRQSYFGVQSLTAQVKALEAAESSSQLALEATQLGYKVGVRVNLDVLNAQTQLFTTKRDLAKARYDTLLTTLKLRQAAGELKPADLQAISELLAK